MDSCQNQQMHLIWGTSCQFFLQIPFQPQRLVCTWWGAESQTCPWIGLLSLGRFSKWPVSEHHNLCKWVLELRFTPFERLIMHSNALKLKEINFKASASQTHMTTECFYNGSSLIGCEEQGVRRSSSVSALLEAGWARQKALFSHKFKFSGLLPFRNSSLEKTKTLG